MEIWKDVMGYEGRYQVSNLGRVKSLKRKFGCFGRAKTSFKEIIIKPTTNSRGYVTMLLWDDGKIKGTTVHRLVATHFIPNNNALELTVNHKNGIKTDNRVENLEWLTRGDNVRHGLKIGLKKSFGRTGKKESKATEKKEKKVRGRRVNKLDAQLNIVTTYPHAIAAENDGYYAPCIYRCCYGTQKTHKGYMWEFAK